jgi:deazaflavin-dependent oxidoreductase (nitroreductase family)
MSSRDVLRHIRTPGVSALSRQLGETPLGVWIIKHLVSPLDRLIYQLTGSRRVSTGRPLGPILLLTTTRRRTGKEHTTPLFYLRDDERLIICNLNPGFDRPNPWTLNLRAHPLVRVQIGREVRIYLAREATEEELGRYWPRLVEIRPAYQTHYNRSGQRILFVLEPDSG